MSATAMPSAQPSQNSLPNQSALPPNANKDNLVSLFDRWKQMKADGVPHDDPELLKLQRVLQSVTQHNQMLQQRRALQQQQQQQPSPARNGEIPNAAHNSQHPTSSPFVPNGQHVASQVDGTAPSGGQQRSAMITTPWMTNEQKTLLRNQMKAFQMLSKNAPLPPEVQRTIFPSQQAEKSLAPVETAETTGKAVNGVADEPTAEAASEEQSGYKTYLSPYSYLQKTIMYTQHSQRAYRPVIPSIIPAGVDIERVREDREAIIFNRIKSRREELSQQSARIDSWDTSKTDTPKPDGSWKRKALIEYKKLGLLEKQRALRQQVCREMVLAENLSMTANRAFYRRMKKHDIREARFTEKLEKEQRNARENKEKQKHNDWLKKILQHANEVRNAADEQQNRLKRLGRMMMTQHQTIEKEEQKRVERTARQRLQALKANDEETYLKLLGQAKDSRISHLLKQTDGFLKQLAASVKNQQRDNMQRWGKKDEHEEDIESDPEEDEDAEDGEDGGGKQIEYYEVAHKIKEEVKQQSPNLVGGLLKEYQLKGLQWMISLYNNNLNGILADEMGLGKTIQTISLITYLIEKKNQTGPFLVIVPLSTLTNWNNEFEKWAPTVQRIVYKGAPNARKQAASAIRYGNFQVLLTTYEFIIKDRPVLSKVKWLHMVVDEGHRMKNANSKLSSTITQYYTTRYRLILTGTPLQNNLPELWALLNFVLPTIFKSVKSFDEWFNTPFANTGGQDKMDLTEEEKLLVIRRLHKVLRPFLLRRLKKDVEKDLPDKQERVIKCSMSMLQRKLYTQLMTHNKLMVSDGKGGKTGMRGLSNMLMQLRKLCNHPFVFEEVEDQVNPQRLSNDLLWRSSGKFELLDRILPKFHETGHRVLMFFQMTQIMNIMEDFMRLRGMSYLRLDGSTKADERADLLRQFNAEDSPYFCFLLSTRAGGLGLNLQSADTVIIFDSDWNPHQDLQAQDRAHRIGQKNEVRILRLISSNSIEEKIFERAQYKLDMDGKVIQAGRFDNKSTNEERDALLRAMLESADAQETIENEEMDDDELNMMMMRSEDELEVFQKIDAEREQDPIYGTGKTPRLLAEDELPEIYMQEDNPIVDEIEEVVGRGARERTRVRYDDGLTEEQWLEAVDDDEDTIEAAIARKDAKVARRIANKEKRARQDNDVADSPLPSRESSESPAPKKRGRKPKRKADEVSLDDDVPAPASAPPPKKRGRQSKTFDTLAPGEREALQNSLERIYEALDDLAEPLPEPDEGERSIIEPFIKLPDRRYYADYYVIVKEPICMEQISNKINQRRYQGLDEFGRDVKLLVENCRTYNEDGSLLFHDAGTIEEKAFALLRSETEEYGSELGAAAFHGPRNAGALGANEDTEDGANGVSNSNSGANTPAPAPTFGGPRLKLNFGKRD